MACEELQRRMISNPTHHAMSVSHGRVGNPPLTSGLELMHAPSYQVLDLFWGDLCPLPRIGPFRLRRARVERRGRFSLLLRRSGVLAPKHPRKEGHVGWSATGN